MSHRRQGMRFIQRVVASIVMLALCAGIPYALGIVARIGFIHYRNTSPPLATTADGVTLSVAHSRYLILDTITVTLTNRSNTPIFVPGQGTASMTGAPTHLQCWSSRVEHLSAHGWQTVGGSSCAISWSPPLCPSTGGTPQGIPYPTEGVVAPGQTIILDTYDGQDSYPPLTPGAYRFSVVYAPTSTQPSSPQARRKSVADLSLMTSPVTVSSAWWIPPWYHQHVDCPKIPPA